MDAGADIRELIERARSGRGDAIGRIFEAARGNLLDLADRELPSDLRAKIGPSDIVQETAVDMQRDFGQFTGTTPEECFAWLREVLQHNVVDAIRRHPMPRSRGPRPSMTISVASPRRLASVTTRSAKTRARAGPAISRQVRLPG
jgi:DNA-directed RNA polymerase specialized sigma24 family protein